MKEVSSREQWKIWVQVAIHSFGGPAGQIAVIHKLVVEDRKLISEERFLHALNFCMLLPGPEAQQLATYLGWLMGKWRGGLLAGGLFILPGFLSILSLSYLYVLYGHLTALQGAFYGMKPAIVAIVLSALHRIAGKSLHGPFHWGLAVSAFLAAYRFPDLAPPLASAFMGSVLVTWMTYAPCFLWIFAGAPYVEYVRGSRPVAKALEAITSSVVGVIFNLSVWFVLKVLFSHSEKVTAGWFDFEVPVASSWDPYAMGICAVALVLRFVFKKGLFTVLGSCVLLGLIRLIMTF